MRFPYCGAGIGLVYKDKLLVGKRNDHPFYGLWAVPGGGREAYDKDDLSTAIRELKEETGIIFTNLNSKKICSWTLKLPFFKWTTYYFSIDCDLSDFKVNEFSELKWVNVSEIKKMHLRPFMAFEVRFLQKYL